MAAKPIPFGPIVDDTGALVAGATITITSVKDMAGANIAGHGATINDDGTGLRVSVNYDAQTKGEAWIQLLVVKAGSTITGLNASPVSFAAADSSVLDSVPASVWGYAPGRTLTAIADSAGVTTLLARLTLTRAAYLDALTALTEGRMVVLERVMSALEETSLGSGIYRWTVLALSRVGIDIAAIRTRTDLALPAAAAGQPTGLARVQDVPTAAQIVAQTIFQETAGLTGRNQVCRDFTYDIRSNVTSFRLRLYDTPENATLDDGETGILCSFLITNTLDDRDRVTKVITKKE